MVGEIYTTQCHVWMYFKFLDSVPFEVLLFGSTLDLESYMENSIEFPIVHLPKIRLKNNIF